MPENLYRTDRAFDRMSEETRRILTHVMFNTGTDWPNCRGRLKRAMTDDEHYAGAERHVFLRECLMKGLSPITEIPETALNEIWKTYMYGALRKREMKKLETEIELSDKEIVSLVDARKAFMDYGYLVCLPKSGTVRLQPWTGTPLRYYARASRALATAKVRMLDRQHLCKADMDDLLASVRKGETGIRRDYTKST